MFATLLATQNTFSLTVLRIAVGLSMLPSGFDKISKFSDQLTEFEKLGIPSWLGALAVIAESFGAIGLILGCLTRIAAIGVGCTMVGAIYWVHFANGLNWKDGYAPHLVVIAACVVLFMGGGGALSVDRWLANRKK
jgi:putative oxidoreductase